MYVILFEQRDFNIIVMCPKDTGGMANSADPEGAIWSGSTMFAQTCLLKILGWEW